MVYRASKLSCWSFRHRTAIVAMGTALLSAVTFAAENLIPNPEFREGVRRPLGWHLSGGEGRWIDGQVLEVTGTGKGSNQWQSDPVSLEPGGLYRFEMRARQTKGSGGCIISGPASVNRDYGGLPGDWTVCGHVFRVPDGSSREVFRLGQWETKGTIQFDSVRLAKVIPIYKPVGTLTLGDGESITAGRYLFESRFEAEGSNSSRTLVHATASFNSNRWCFYGRGEVTYRFGLPGHRLLSGEASVTVGYHTRGACQVEVSRDGATWRAVTSQPGVGTAQAALPGELFPAEAIFLRLRTSGQDDNFQVYQLRFEAQLDGQPPEGVGKTTFAEVDWQGQPAELQSLTLDDDFASGRAVLRAVAKNPGASGAPFVLSARVRPPNASADHEALVVENRTTLKGGQTGPLELELPAQRPGKHLVELTARLGERSPIQAQFRLDVPAFYRSDYGEMIAGEPGKTAIWWCDATWKVPRRRALPTATGRAATLFAAKNDHEAVQIVVRPSEPLEGLTASVGPLVGPQGATIPPKNIKVLRVYYHYVAHPSDATGVRDWWPDALPPFDKPITVPAGQNQPLWVLVHVPHDAKAGDYEGSLRLEAKGLSVKVPIRLHVWDFALPERNHLETAFGFNPGEVFRYHQAKTDADRRKLLDLYFQSFAEHRISPFDPTPLDHFRVKFVADAKPPRAEIDFSAFDRAMAAAIEKYRFTNFQLRIEGMGGGTFHARWEPSIDRFGEQTPEYQAMFSSQVQQIESHLREKGWLQMAYVYWFDEPDPKDYAFVRNGMERLHRYAPGIQRMLTEEPVEALAGAVDIWCPLSANYDHAAAEKRRAQGERFWWYVCTGPRAPYCTLFIDHPATELRVWHWQTWQRKIVGTLIWATNYWTSEAAYPDAPQNPYEDPMSYVSGYDTPKGTRNFWGNGDGRFLYPPEAAAVPGKSGPGPVLEGPVSSIRWEMLREGVEDYEFLWLLRDLLEKKRSRLRPEDAKRYESLLEVPEAITKDMTTFTVEPAPIYNQRAAIAEAIEALSR